MARIPLAPPMSRLATPMRRPNVEPSAIDGPELLRFARNVAAFAVSYAIAATVHAGEPVGAAVPASAVHSQRVRAGCAPAHTAGSLVGGARVRARRPLGDVGRTGRIRRVHPRIVRGRRGEHGPRRHPDTTVRRPEVGARYSGLHRCLHDHRVRVANARVPRIGGAVSDRPSRRARQCGRRSGPATRHPG